MEVHARVLGAIAWGAYTRKEIAARSTLGDVNRAGWYLGTLVELGLVEHRQPVSCIGQRRQWGTYHIRDPFFRFWHRWVLPRRSYLEIGQGQIEEVGSWWSRRAQIDIVAVNRRDRQVVFGEAKWQRATVTQTDLDSLVNRGLQWLEGAPCWDVHYAFLAREFGRVAHTVSSDPRVHLYTPEDVVRTDGGEAL